jgi:hypothetical protein
MIGKSILHYPLAGRSVYRQTKFNEQIGSPGEILNQRHAESRRRTDPSTDGLVEQSEIPKIGDSASSLIMRSRNKSAGRQIPASGERDDD